MSKVGINTGSAPNAGDGSSLLAGANAINDNFNELYALLGDGSTLVSGVATVTGGDIDVTGIVTASNFSGSGAGLTSLQSPQLTGALPAIDGKSLTGIVTSIVAGTNISVSGSGTGSVTVSASGGGASGNTVVIKDDGSTVGAAGTINFGTGVAVSGLSAGIVTVTASGGSGGVWSSNAAGINTSAKVGIGTTTADSFYELEVQGNANITGFLTATTLRGAVIGDVTGNASSATLAVNAQGLSGTPSVNVTAVNATGFSTFTNNVQLRSSDGTPGRLDYYCEVSNAHYTRIQAAPHAQYSGNVTAVLPTISGDLVVGDTATAINQSVNTTGVITATSFDGSNVLKSRTTVTGSTGSIANNAIGNVDITGFKSYGLIQVGLSTAGWLRIYTDNAARVNDVNRSVGEDPTPGDGVIADIVTTGVSTTKNITPFTLGGNLDSPVSDKIYIAVTNLSGTTQAISANLTILKLEV